MYRRAILASATAFLVASAARSDVTITVVDDKGKPLVGGARVTVLKHPDRTAITDADGNTDNNGKWVCKAIPTKDVKDFYIIVSPHNGRGWKPVAQIELDVKDKMSITVMVRRCMVPPPPAPPK